MNEYTVHDAYGAVIAKVQAGTNVVALRKARKFYGREVTVRIVVRTRK